MTTERSTRLAREWFAASRAYTYWIKGEHLGESDGMEDCASLAALLDAEVARVRDAALAVAASRFEAFAAECGSRMGRRNGGPSENMVWDEAFGLAAKSAIAHAAACCGRGTST